MKSKRNFCTCCGKEETLEEVRGTTHDFDFKTGKRRMYLTCVDSDCKKKRLKGYSTGIGGF